MSAKCDMCGSMTNCNKDYEYEGFSVDITRLLKIMDEGKF
jgi:hypothetical protein